MIYLLTFSALLVVILVARFFLGTARTLISTGASSQVAVFVLLAATLTALLLVLPNLNATAELTISDEVEYLVAAINFVEHSTYSFELAGNDYPPRYPPWFSVLGLAPFIALPNLAGFNSFAEYVIAARVFQFLAALVLLLAAIRISALLNGRQLATAGKSSAALLAVAAVAAVPGLQYFSSKLMIDLPLVAASTLVLWFVLSLRSELSSSGHRYFAVGILIAVAFGLRSTALALLLPVLWTILTCKTDSLQPRASKSALTLTPVLLIATLTALYNQSISGSPFRSGYHLWLSVPYDFPGLVTNLSYLTANLYSLFSDGSLALLLIGFIGVALISRREKVVPVPILQGAAAFLLLGLAPIVLFHLLYFYFSPRFFLALSVTLAILIASFIPNFVALSQRVGALFLLLVLGLLLGRSQLSENTSDLKTLQSANFTTECNSVIATDINPLLAETILNQKCLKQVIPLSREVEFASKLFSPNAPFGLEGVPKEELPTNPRNHRAKILFRFGAQEIYPSTVDELSSQERAGLGIVTITGSR